MLAARNALLTLASGLYAGQTISYSLGSGGSSPSGATNGNAGGTTTVTFQGTTLTSTGGGGGFYNSASTASGGTGSGGDGASTGGTGPGASGNVGGGSGGAVGGTAGTRASGNAGDAGAQSADVSGLQTAVTGTSQSWTAGGTAGPSGDGTTLLGTTAYTQSNVYSSNTAANWAGMNDGSANGSTTTQTGVNSGTGNYVQANCGSSIHIDHIVIGYDYLNNLPGGWGTSYTEGLTVQGSNDASSWTTITTTPTYASSGSSNGLVSITINATWQYIRLFQSANNYMATLEFEIWTGGGSLTTNTNNGGNATGFGSGGGSAGYDGGNGGSGLYGGGGGGAAGYSTTQTGGAGGAGAAVFQFTGGTPQYVLQTSGTSYTVPSGTSAVKIWAIGAGGSGAGAGASDSTSGGGGGAGGVAYKSWSGGPTYTYTVYVPYRNGVQHILGDLSGSFSDLITGGNSSAPWAAADSSGNIYATGLGYSSQKVVKITQAGVKTDLTTAGLGATLTGVAVSADGSTVYVADATNVAVQKIVSGIMTTLGFTGLSAPAGVAVDSAGSVYVADTTNKIVKKITTGGVQSTVTLTGVNTPKGIAFDSADTMYIADTGNTKAYRRNSDGTVTDLGFTFTTGVAGGIAVDANGTVFVLDLGYNLRSKTVGGSFSSVIVPAGGGNSSRITGITVGPPTS